MLVFLLLLVFLSSIQALNHSFFSGEVVKEKDKSYYVPYGTEVYDCLEVNEYIVNGFSNRSAECKDNRLSILDSALFEERKILKCELKPETCYPGNLNIDFNYSVRKLEPEADIIYSTMEGILLDYIPSITKNDAILDAYSRMSGNPVLRCRHTNYNVSLIDMYNNYMLREIDIRELTSTSNNVPFYISFPQDFIGGTIWVQASYASLSGFPSGSEITEKIKEYEFLVVSNDKLYLSAHVDDEGLSNWIYISFSTLPDSKDINFYQRKPIYKNKSIVCDDNLSCVYPVFYQYLVDFQSAILEKRLCEFRINNSTQVYDCGGKYEVNELRIREDNLKCNLCVKGECKMVDYPVEIDDSSCYDYTIDCTGYITFYSNSCYLNDDPNFNDFDSEEEGDSHQNTNHSEEYVIIPIGIECGFSLINIDSRCKEYWSEILTWIIISIIIACVIVMIILLILVKLKILRWRCCNHGKDKKMRNGSGNVNSVNTSSEQEKDEEDADDLVDDSLDLTDTDSSMSSSTSSSSTTFN